MFSDTSYYKTICRRSSLAGCNRCCNDCNKLCIVCLFFFFNNLRNGMIDCCSFRFFFLILLLKGCLDLRDEVKAAD